MKNSNGFSAATVVAFAGLAAWLQTEAQAAASCTVRSARTATAVVELYTSEIGRAHV